MSKRIHNLFTRINGQYDYMNHFFSAGFDIVWRKEAARDIVKARPARILDVATGTGDLAIEIWKEAKKRNLDVEIEAIDFNEGMLKVARRKVKKLGIEGIHFRNGNALKLNYKDSSFDLVTSGMALRNFDDLSLFCREAKRVLKKDGTFLQLDMAKPDSKVDRAFFRVYFVGMRAIGKLVDYESYDWLTSSIDNFDKKGFVRMVKKIGYKTVGTRSLQFGVAYIISAKK